jgi:hypothetical protein
VPRPRIDFLEVELDDLFAEGQGYVALSRLDTTRARCVTIGPRDKPFCRVLGRATSLEGLRVVSFDPLRFWASRKVTAFYEQLQSRPVREETTPEGQWRGIHPNWVRALVRCEGSSCLSPWSGRWLVMWPPPTQVQPYLGGSGRARQGRG